MLVKWTPLLALCFANPVLAQADDDDFFSMSLEELIEVQISVATGSAQSLIDAPAIVSVITAEDIAFWNYASVAEAVASVPGIYCIDDRLAANCGVRGINGGFRGYNRVFKVMIDGHDIAFRSDSNSYLGPELIPVEVIERIEIVRGPGSALYGANAFLGVINIISREDLSRSSQLHSRIGEDQLHASFALQDQRRDSGYLFSVSAAYHDRSGTKVPDTIPARSRFVAGASSRNDLAAPVSLFAKSHWRAGDHALSLQGRFSRLDSRASFVDFGRFAETGQLGDETRVSLDSWQLSLDDDWRINESLNARLGLSWGSGQPSSKEFLDVGLSESVPERDFGYDSLFGKAELRWTLADANTLTVGVDYLEDREQLFESFDIDRESGERTRKGIEQGEKNFRDLGLYAQFSGKIFDRYGITANVRHDNHSIYGDNSNYRLGFVYRFSPRIGIKLLYGTSFKAPAAIQLFGQPLFDGEVTGNRDLQAEEASTYEAQLNWSIDSQLSGSFNLFSTRVNDKVELVPSGTNQVPLNQGEQKSEGVEGVLHWTPGNNQLSLRFAWQQTDVDSLDLVGREIVQPSELFPEQMVDFRWIRRFDERWSIGIKARYFSPRRASDSNILLNGGAPYQTDAYSLLDAVVNYRLENIRYALRFKNLTDEDYTDPGFAGIDVPGFERHVEATVSLNF